MFDANIGLMPRFLAAQPDTRLITLPWDTPLADWPQENFVALPRGISRHVVRFVRVGNEVYAFKEVMEHLAVHEYQLLRDLTRLDTPSVEPVGVVTARVDRVGKPIDPILITRHLQFSLPYRSLFNRGVRQDTVNRLVDAMVVLLARLHLIGFLWGDVSLSNTLFRRDAGAFAAHLVDAETSELHDKLTDGQREHDLTIARTNLYGEFSDLEAGGLLDAALDPLVLVETIESRYRELWESSRALRSSTPVSCIASRAGSGGSTPSASTSPSWTSPPTSPARPYESSRRSSMLVTTRAD